MTEQIMTEEIMTDRERTALQLSRAREALEKVWPMIESKHTPGPWFVVVQHPRKHANNDRLLIQSGTANICTLDVAGREYDNDKANARLIAAAPELLAACEAALKLDYMQEHNALASQLRAAVAKAKGEKP